MIKEKLFEIVSRVINEEGVIDARYWNWEFYRFFSLIEFCIWKLNYLWFEDIKAKRAYSILEVYKILLLISFFWKGNVPNKEINEQISSINNDIISAILWINSSVRINNRSIKTESINNYLLWKDFLDFIRSILNLSSLSNGDSFWLDFDNLFNSSQSWIFWLARQKSKEHIAKVLDWKHKIWKALYDLIAVFWEIQSEGRYKI